MTEARSAPGAVPPAVTEAVAAAVGGDHDDLRRLLAALSAVDAGGDMDAARSTLRLLARTPRLLTRLDEHVRWNPWRAPYRSPEVDRLAAALTSPTVGPVAVAVAASHPDGRVRERAVRVLLSRPVPELTPFLVLRTADWARPVRDVARAGLALLLADEPATHLPAAVPATALVSVRNRGGFVLQQVTAALQSAPERLRAEVSRNAPTAQRRVLFDLDLAHGRLRVDDLLAAVADRDVRIRARAAEAAAREAVWTGRLPVLRRLAGNRHAEVRALGLIGLLRLGRHAEVSAVLDDRHQLVRAIAREAARREGVDVPAAYRAAVSDGAPSVGAVAGLVEVGTDGDAPLLHPLLTHPDPRLRAAAVRALARMGAVPVPPVVALLRDPAAGVVREAATALRPISGALPPGLAWELLADERVELRRAGYRLLGTSPPALRLRAGLLLVKDPDPRLAERARADVTGLSRASVSTYRWEPPPPELELTARLRDELLRLTAAAGPALADRTLERLTDWLRRG
ncbi:HEAT repeat domain-containing protein [Micromonospora chersina]|uniref:HEAT repeat domain-containing protein n=1 Tax=Micromonospora chersina TaxID=47854 RepID=UPI003788A4D7